MNSRSFLKILMVLFIVVVLAIVGGYFYLSNTKTTIQHEDTGTLGGVAPAGEIPTPTYDPNATNNSFEGNVPRLRKISATPVSGADIFNRKEGTTTRAYIRFVDRGTGNIYETATSSLEITRITNTTIPKVNSAFFGNNGNSIALQYLDSSDNIQTFVGKASGTSSDLTGNFLPLNAQSPAVSPAKNRLFFMLSTSNGSSWYTSDFSSKKPAQVFSHALSGWQIHWPNEASLIATTKPTSISGGVAYQFNLKGSSLIKLLGPKNGLVTLASPKIDNLLFSETRNNSLSAGLFNTKLKTEKQISQPTIPDKCVWSSTSTLVYCGSPKYIPPGQYPDIWYQGLVTFDDRITSLTTFYSEPVTVIDPGAIAQEQIDAVDLHLSPFEDYLIFTNKNDLSLWGLRLK